MELRSVAAAGIKVALRIRQIFPIPSQSVAMTPGRFDLVDAIAIPVYSILDRRTATCISAVAPTVTFGAGSKQRRAEEKQSQKRRLRRRMH
jgi:hypothetical protein